MAARAGRPGLRPGSSPPGDELAHACFRACAEPRRSRATPAASRSGTRPSWCWWISRSTLPRRARAPRTRRPARLYRRPREPLQPAQLEPPHGSQRQSCRLAWVKVYSGESGMGGSGRVLVEGSRLLSLLKS